MSLISHAVGFRRKRMNDKCCREKKPGTQKKKKKMKEGQWMTDGFPSRLKIMQWRSFESASAGVDDRSPKR